MLQQVLLLHAMDVDQYLPSFFYSVIFSHPGNHCDGLRRGRGDRKYCEIIIYDAYFFFKLGKNFICEKLARAERERESN